MKKFLQGKKDRAAQAFKTAKQAAVGTALMAGSSIAMAADNTSIQAALDANKGTVELIVAGIFALALVITGLGIMMKLLNR